eukprot:g13157.t1
MALMCKVLAALPRCVQAGQEAAGITPDASTLGSARFAFEHERSARPSGPRAGRRSGSQFGSSGWEWRTRSRRSEAERTTGLTTLGLRHGCGGDLGRGRPHPLRRAAPSASRRCGAGGAVGKRVDKLTRQSNAGDFGKPLQSCPARASAQAVNGVPRARVSGVPFEGPAPPARRGGHTHSAKRYPARNKCEPISPLVLNALTILAPYHVNLHEDKRRALANVVANPGLGRVAHDRAALCPVK